MPPKKNKDSGDPSVLNYSYDTKRKNIPPAGLAAQGKVAKEPKKTFLYNPHLPPVLRFDPNGKSDALPELLETAKQRPLTDEETRILADALHSHEPWLEWAGKREAKACEVDPVELHIHERVSTQAILKVAARQDVQRNLFADPEMDYQDAVRFYQFDMDWANRLILGDSLAVMASLSRREALAGKVQMMYMDPPYGIKFGSNFQSEVGKRDVGNRSEDLTREAEMVKAYRGTWTLGVHSYLAYLRDRLYAAKELLADSGSVFMQIGDENVHLVRSLMDEVFGSENFISQITLKKMGGLAAEFLAGACDHILWFGKDVTKTKYRQLYLPKILGEGKGTGARYDGMISVFGERIRLPDAESDFDALEEAGWRAYQPSTLTTFGSGGSSFFAFDFQGNDYWPSSSKGWLTTLRGLRRLAQAGRVIQTGKAVRYVRCLADFAAYQLNNVWADIASPPDVVYVVQTSTATIARCVLMTTDPGDLVLDPTCGSGSTACVAEQWGRRWITIDTSRVALAIARQRLLTAKFDYYRLRSVSAEDLERNPNGQWLTDPEEKVKTACTFDSKTMPHIMLKSIAQNEALDPIFEKWEPILAGRLTSVNTALRETVTPDLRRKLNMKLLEKQKSEGKKAITDADRRRWQLPENEWKEWEAPFDTDPDWPTALQEALSAYRKAWREKMDEVNDMHRRPR